MMMMDDIIRVCVYWLGSYPHTFYKLYSVESFILFPIRWKSFKKMKMHYYMFDFCYVANLLLLIFLWVFPRSAFLSKVRLHDVTDVMER